MNAKLLPKWSLGLLLALAPLVGCAEKANPPGPMVMQNNIQPIAVATNESVVEEQSDELANAPAEIVSSSAIPEGKLSPAAAEIAKLAQAGVDESVLMAFVTNSTNTFLLTSEDIIYLNDIGVPAPVLTAMIQRDQSVKATAATEAPEAITTNPTPANPTNVLVPVPGAPVPYATAPVQTEEAAATQTVVEPPLTPPQGNVSYTYFYDSLAPYGTWIDVSGYGLCWRPTVAAVDVGWQPYVNRGRWVYTDCGWYWVSDYSWGWAPFHYGRWFRHSRWGWCWAPDTVWGPAWVSWRYTSDYCGWAPLPPSACYQPGYGFTYYGRSVGVSFGFGLSASSYCFVPVRNVCDRYVVHHRITHRHAHEVYHHTKPLHRYDRDERNRVVNRGIPVEHVSATTRNPIRPIPTRDTDRPAPARFEREGPDNTRLAVYRPRLPEPDRPARLVGEGVRPATIRSGLRPNLARPAENGGATSTLQPRAVNTPVRDSRRENRLERTPAQNGPAAPDPAVVNAPEPQVQPRERSRPIREMEPRSRPVMERQADRPNTTVLARVPEPAPERPGRNADVPRVTRPERNQRPENIQPVTRVAPPRPVMRSEPVAPKATTPNVIPTPAPAPHMQTPVPTRQAPQFRAVEPRQPAPRPEPQRPSSTLENRRMYRTESERVIQAPRRFAPEPQMAPAAPRTPPPSPAYQPPRVVEPRHEPRINPEPRHITRQREVNPAPRMQAPAMHAPAPVQNPAMQEMRPSHSQPSNRPQRANRGERNRDR